MRPLTVSLALTAAFASASAVPRAANQSPTVQAPAGTITGSLIDSVEYFRGIPYAEPPVGNLRLRGPVRAQPQSVIQATGVGPACPQMTNSVVTPLLGQAISDPEVAGPLFLGSAFDNGQEDCLTISVMRPENTPADAKLPVLFWMHGGGFAIGSSQAYNGSVIITRAAQQGKPFILVAVNYRLGAFGFLGGAEVLAENSTNLGLLDQRMGLEWIADNIASFGGDPDAVTISGESAGSISVFDQMALYNGDNTYGGRPLFRGAIMHSGSIQTREPVDGPSAQKVFDTVVAAANCSSETDKLECLRNADYDTFWQASMSVPSFLSNSSIALSYTPRQDGKILTDSTDVLAKQGRFAQVPMIIGDVKDEGTIFSLFPVGIANQDELVSYLSSFIYKHASRKEITTLLNTYPTGGDNNTYAGFTQLAGMLGDAFFTMKRRELLDYLPAKVPAWSFLGNWLPDTPIVKTFHTSDVPRLFYYTDSTSKSIQDRYFSFITSANPNDGDKTLPYWPSWHKSRQSLEFGANEATIIPDNFRKKSYEFIKSHKAAFQL
ncbi:unnamed protein product [Clonostachys rosea f. rosea IK726]|uniref:Carboxylic ester hydrolase n=2 Tax=Bionectria ochroleuca TaxID=29856 RepID=A0A8H7KCF8_BIOOC|nr:unnamed protein product [Clonostachys rosea f. rosea IK726]